MDAKEALARALDEIMAEMGLAAPARLVIEAPREARFGDLSANAAMLLAREAGKAPRVLAGEMAAKLWEKLPVLADVQVAGPGFINVTFGPRVWQAVVGEIESAGANWGRSGAGRGRKALVEYVSANPTGPLHVGHGAARPLGIVWPGFFFAAGYDVATEYYLNDAGRQMRTLGLSIWLRARELNGEKLEFPADCYQGGYIRDLAAELLRLEPNLLSLPEADGLARCQAFGTEKILAGIREDLAAFGCRIDNYASENALVQSGAVASALDRLARDGKSFEQDGALWLNTMEHGDAKNRVLRKSDGYLTYFATDIAYHNDKFQRGHEWLIDVWGADHHGYIPRLKAGIEDMGHDSGRFSVMLVQLVNLLRKGQAVAMSTRSGEFVTLAEVIAEVGRDAARFMFLSRSSDSPLDFDLDLARQRTMENPVYYVQYAHARVHALLRRAGDRNIRLPQKSGADVLARLELPEEIAILRHLAAFPESVANAAKNLAPHHISKYLLDLSALMHSYYAKFRIISADDLDGTLARLALLRAAGQVLANGLALLGVSAPESM